MPSQLHNIALIARRFGELQCQHGFGAGETS